jgi:hypothetical protein
MAGPVMTIWMPKETSLSLMTMKSKLKKMQQRQILVYEVVKCWVTGDRAEIDVEDIERERVEELRYLMELSGQN